MRRIFIAALAAAILLGAGVAQGELMRKGNLLLSFDGRFSPQSMPRDRDIPVSVTLNGSVRNTEGVRPPQLRRMSIAVNRHGRISTVGLPVCRPDRLEATSAKAALARCRGALVGRGRFAANVDFPDLMFPVAGRMLAFNSRDRGRPTIALHISGSTPVAVTVILIFRIHHPRKGRFGTVLSTRIPKIAADLGYVTDIWLTFGRTYRHRGQTRSFISARCAAPAGFPGALFTFARGSFVFANGQKFEPTLVRSCRVR